MSQFATTRDSHVTREAGTSPCDKGKTNPLLVAYRGDTAHVALPGGMNLERTFQCGQAFRWALTDDGGCVGVAGRYRVTVRVTADGLTITPCDEAAFEGFWRRYLDLERDYNTLEERLAADPVLTPVVAGCRGMRLLNQPVWECLTSFLLSSNNNVRRISGIVERLCASLGEDCDGWYAFPTPRAMLEAGEEALRACGAGYRAAYLWRAAREVCAGFPVEELPRMGYGRAKEQLMTLHGVGEKVADCVLLFSCGYGQAFPVDVWVARAMAKHYPQSGGTAAAQRAFALEHFGDLAGLAQQLLFHYERIYIRT